MIIAVVTVEQQPTGFAYAMEKAALDVPDPTPSEQFLIAVAQAAVKVALAEAALALKKSEPIDSARLHDVCLYAARRTIESLPPPDRPGL
jgi:hypothetical protein